jgi:hypothetical protein
MSAFTLLQISALTKLLCTDIKFQFNSAFYLALSYTFVLHVCP